MKIELHEISIRELTTGYKDNSDDGVTGYGGKLDIRPPYQREFIYKDKQRDAVINTVINNFPLNVMYWAVKPDGTFEIIDGQQRTISICQYVNGEFSHDNKYFHNLRQDEKNQILDYTVMVYFCSGSESEKLEWFKTINISGEKLSDQELRNAVYAGPWVTDAKRYFSKNKCAAVNIGGDYLSGSHLRQDYLETAIRWISDGNIEEYMAIHQNDPNSSALWIYFQSLISWVTATFKTKNKNMKSVNWGYLYNNYKNTVYDTNAINDEVSKLMMDGDVSKKSGIYPYILTRDEKYLNLRAFDDSIKQEVYAKQQGICVKCGKQFKLEEMDADHITPWSLGGKTIIENCQLLCKNDNRRKSYK